MYFDIISANITNNPFLTTTKNRRTGKALVYPLVQVEVAVNIDGVVYEATYTTEPNSDNERWGVGIDFNEYRSKNMQNLIESSIITKQQIKANKIMIENTAWLEEWIITQDEVQALLLIEITAMTDPISGNKEQWASTYSILKKIQESSPLNTIHQSGNSNDPVFFYFYDKKHLVAFNEKAQYYHVTPFVDSSILSKTKAITNFIRRIKDGQYQYEDVKRWNMKPVSYTPARKDDKEVLVFGVSDINDYDGLILDHVVALSNRDLSLMKSSKGEPYKFQSFQDAAKWIERHESLASKWSIFLS